VIHVTDAADNLPTLTYDSLGRHTALADPGQGAWINVCDDNDNLHTQLSRILQNTLSLFIIVAPLARPPVPRRNPF
jgi:hypothetical protein